MPGRSTGRGQTNLGLTRPAARAPPGLHLSTPAPGEATPANKHDEGQLTGQKTPLNGRRSGVPAASSRRWEKSSHFIGQLPSAQAGQPPVNKVLTRPRYACLVGRMRLRADPEKQTDNRRTSEQNN
ncbi:unnamed protein product [Echinostoma caproni]|uniref:Uncharacterized protein n=1 Tax=Echinostoma caproni TaxID=27848 RepID=A0A183AYI7_9TREM|nr:unnamed protein product [Echinostoma caproni]